MGSPESQNRHGYRAGSPPGPATPTRGPVACARTSGTVTLWDAERREILRTLDWKAGKLVSVAFSPDGTLAAAGTEAGQVVVWDADL